jgi:hypothetical protein
MVPVERIELPTFGLQNRCSTAELNRLKVIDRIGAGGRICVPHDGSVYGRRPGRVNRRIPANRFQAVLCRTTEAIIRFVVGNASPDVNPPGARAFFAAEPGMTGLHKQKGRHKCRPSLGREVS